jgi:hypothetical protein
MSYRQYRFLDNNQNSQITQTNNMSITNSYVNNTSNIEKFTNYFDNNVSEYAQSNSDYFNIQNNMVQDTDFGTNGRVYFDIKKPTPTYKLFETQNKTQGDIRNTLNYSQEETPLSNAYFSKTNIDILQMHIKQEVFKRCENDTDPILTNHKPIHISNQDETSLQVIMRSIYLQYAKNSPTNIDNQVIELNNLVIAECVPDIITNLKQYLGYVADIQRLPNPLDHPSYVSSKGEKTYSLLVL